VVLYGLAGDAVGRLGRNGAEAESAACRRITGDRPRISYFKEILRFISKETLRISLQRADKSRTVYVIKVWLLFLLGFLPLGAAQQSAGQPLQGPG
jgi:hypothetical protein